MYKDQIVTLIKSIVGENISPNVTVPPQLSHGDYMTNVAFGLASVQKKNPNEIARELKEKIDQKKPEYLEKVEVVGGYINFFLSEKVAVENLRGILEDTKNYGRNKLFDKKRIMVEFAHPNPFKVMHIGHLRNLCLGESIVRMLEQSGAEVIRTNYQGDVGMHVAKCLWALLKVSESEYPTDINGRVKLLGDSYVKGAAAYEESEEAKHEIQEVNKKIYTGTDEKVSALWKMGVKWSLDKFHTIFKRFYTHFEREYMESEVASLGVEKVKDALKKGILKESEGAIVFPGEEHALDTRVFLNSQGLPTYEGKELGLAYREFSDFGHIDLCIHNVAVEQISFFKVTFKVEELLDPELFKGKQYHNAYEFVGLTSGKMSSRKGQVVTAESIIDQAGEKIRKIVKDNAIKISDEDIDAITVAAIKYSFLKMSPFKYLAFDLNSSVSFTGDSGPYMQYAYTRCQSILKKANVKNIDKKVQISNLEPDELFLAKKLYRYPDVVALSAVKYDPHHISDYLNELTQQFNSFYAKHQVINSDRSELRLALVKAVAQVVQNGLYLMGIQTVERM